MPLFKKVEFSALGVKYSFRINVNENGIFWCKIPKDVVNHTTLNEDETAPSFKELEGRINWAIQAWKEEETVCTYFIKYRLALSSRVKSKMPREILDREIEGCSLWNKTKSAGNNYHGGDETALIFKFQPMVKKTEGTNISIQGLEIGTPDNFYVKQLTEAIAARNRGEKSKYHPQGAPDDFIYYQDMMHKPFSDQGNDLLFVVGGNNSWLDSQYDFWIPLTLETWEFFNNVDSMLINIATKMLSFLGDADESKILENITNALKLNNGVLRID